MTISNYMTIAEHAEYVEREMGKLERLQEKTEDRMQVAESNLQNLQRLVKSIQWKTDKDNMEYTVTIPYTLMDEINKYLK